jgi:hypothetical protein
MAEKQDKQPVQGRISSMRVASRVRNELGFQIKYAKRINFRLLIFMLATLAALSSARSGAQTSVTTYHNDIGRTGQNLNETILTTSNVNATQFGKLFSQAVDGQIYAQPLYLPGLSIGGQTHNVVFVATENDTVYAFDADTNAGANASPLWKASMLTSAHGAASGAAAFPASELAADITPLVGITGTPVIDPTTNTLYVVSKSLENGSAVQRLHALDVTTGNEKFGGPVVVTATIAGTGNGSVSGQLTFDPMWENQRPALLLVNGILYVGFAAHGDNGPWHGWILAYNAATLKQTSAYNASPNGVGSGFWMSGSGLAADVLSPSTKPYGRLFATTGNGDYTGKTPYANTMDYGDSILNLDLTNGVPKVQDEFTPFDQAALDAEDGDLGSGGVMLIPTQTTGSVPNLLVQVGKAGTLYLVNRDNMSGYNSSDAVVQEMQYAVGVNGAWSTAAYWNGNVYYMGRGDFLKSFALVNGKLSTSPTKSTEVYNYPGATPSISANGNTNGIVWTIDSEAYGTSGNAILQAHNASNVAQTLYSSSTNSSRDSAGPAIKFSVPTVVNGKVYVGTGTQVSVYGLLGGAQQTAAPVISPASQSFTGSISVTMTDSTSGATIYYTTDGSTPTTSSTKYTGAITVSSTTTINAIASATNLLVSSMSSATYTSITQATAPTISPAGGTYTSAQTVTMSDSMAGATIYYTTNGTTPTTSSTKYTAAITVSATQTISAIAVVSGLTNSPVSTATFTIVAPGTGINFPQGFAASAGQIVLNGNAQLDDSRLQLTDGGQYEASSAWYVSPVNVQSFTTDFTFQLSNPVADGITFAIQNNSNTIVGPSSANLGYAYIPNSIAIKFDLYNNQGEGSDSTGLYTNGATPMVPALDMTSSGVNLHSDDTMAVHVVYDGTTLTMTITDNVTGASYSHNWTINIPTTIGSNTAYVGFTGASGYSSSSQKILTWSFNNTPVLPVPTFTPAAGTYTTTQSVTISDSSSGATIYYTTNSTTPTTSSTKYTAPISVTASETIQAIAVAAGYTNSAVASATYTIAPVLPTPTFSPAGGTYTTAQSVTISDSSSGATIYYTTNGTTPTTSSTKYTGAISVSASETIQAIAVATGYSNSAVASATYTITPVLPTPTFAPAGGTYSAAQSVTISDSSSGVTIYYTTNGTTPTTSSTKYTGPISVAASETIQAIAVATGYTNSAVASATYTISTGTVAATPTFSPAPGTYVNAQTVTISDSTPGATIYYTTNGTTPTTSSAKYSSALNISLTQTIKAIAVASGYSNSAVATGAYTITTPTVATPVLSPGGGTYSSPQTVTITEATPGASLYYTTDGTVPSRSSPLYTGPIVISQSLVLKVLGAETGYYTSAMAAAAYTINTSGTTLNMGAGFTTSSGMVLNGSQLSGTALMLTNGGQYQATSSWYSTPVNVQSFTTDFTFQLTNAVADGFTFAIQNNNSTVVGASAGNLGYGYIPNSVAIKFDLFNNKGEGSDSTGLFTNGAPPMTPATDMTSSGVILSGGNPIAAHVVYNGTTLTMTLTDTVTKASFTTSWKVNIPSTIGSNTAYVGFTGGTGYSTSTQKILNWTYSTP